MVEDADFRDFLDFDVFVGGVKMLVALGGFLADHVCAALICTFSESFSFLDFCFLLPAVDILTPESVPGVRCVACGRRSRDDSHWGLQEGGSLQQGPGGQNEAVGECRCRQHEHGSECGISAAEPVLIGPTGVRALGTVQ